MRIENLPAGWTVTRTYGNGKAERIEHAECPFKAINATGISWVICDGRGRFQRTDCGRVRYFRTPQAAIKQIRLMDWPH